jgi:hypothetical protein
MASTNVSGFDPASNRACVTLKCAGSRGHVVHQGFLLANPYARATVGATLFNHRFFFDQANRANRAIPDAITASITFFNINYHGITAFWCYGELE